MIITEIMVFFSMVSLYKKHLKLLKKEKEKSLLLRFLFLFKFFESMNYDHEQTVLCFI